MSLTVCLLGHGPLSDGGACLSCGATMVSPVSWRHEAVPARLDPVATAPDALAHLEAKRVELQERVDIAEAKADALEGELRFAHSMIRAVAHSACTRHMLEWSPEDIRKGLSRTKADRCSACRCADFLDGKPDTDLDTALALLRRYVAPLEVETEDDRGATKPDAVDLEAIAFLAAHPVSP